MDTSTLIGGAIIGALCIWSTQYVAYKFFSEENYDRVVILSLSVMILILILIRIIVGESA